MHSSQRVPVQTGLDVFLQEVHPSLRGKRVGLITNPTGVHRSLQNNIDLLHADRRIRLQALFGPEHGIRGEVQAGVKVAGTLDQRTGLPVYSLYGQTRRPTVEMLNGLDALIFDLQDLGTRYSTYIGTLAYVQEVAAQANVDVIIFDRPNPITGVALEGNLLDPAFTSFVGVHTIPIRHGMTIGELGRLLAFERGWPEPTVLTMRNWQRSLWYDDTYLPYVQPSPNLPTCDALTLYPGTCLIEGTGCSEGRGTTRPFELIGAPNLDPFLLAEELNRRQLAGVSFRPTFFVPTFSKHANITCGGVQIHLLERAYMRPVEIGLHLLSVLRSIQGDAFSWTQATNGTYFIDLLFGSSMPREALEQGVAVPVIMAGWQQQLDAFAVRRQPFLLYA